MKWIFSRLLVLGFCFLSCAPLRAAEFFVLPNTNQLFMLGETTEGDLETLKLFYNRENIDYLHVAGPGGELVEAFKIANFIKSNNIKTETVANRDCESACAFIFMSGIERKMGEGSRIGIHLPFLNINPLEDEIINNYIVQEYCKEATSTYRDIENFGSCIIETYSLAFNDANQIIRLFTASGIDAALLVPLMATSPEDMYYIGEDEAKKMNLVGFDKPFFNWEEREDLQRRLADADAELTAMTLALEAQRKKAEDTLTLLAAADAARENLDINLANALLAQAQAEAALERMSAAKLSLEERLTKLLEDGRSRESSLLRRIATGLLMQARTDDELKRLMADNGDLQAQLSAAILLKDSTEKALIEAHAALSAAVDEERIANYFSWRWQDLQSRLAEGEQAKAELTVRLAEALLARQALEAKVAALSDTQDETAQGRADLEGRLAEALAANAAAKANATEMMTERERQAALLAQANKELSAEQALSAESQRQVALLNEQVVELRRYIATLQALLDIADQTDAEANVQIESLGAQLNAALARVASEERQRRALEEAERIRLEAEKARLEAEARDLESYKSEFFGQIRTVLAGQEGIRVEGDRFVFSSEVLFETARADLSDEGRAELAKLAAILRTISAEIPSEIDWIIRVDGHTDNVPLTGGGLYRNNWELSQARALSVVIYMVEQEGIEPHRLAALGFGEYQPINPADTPEARAQNRRIELKLTER